MIALNSFLDMVDIVLFINLSFNNGHSKEAWNWKKRKQNRCEIGMGGFECVCKIYR